MKIVIILPTYNERENIVELLEGLRRAVRGIKNHTFTYLVVDDSSPDGTGAEVKQYQRSHADVHLITGKKQGLGKALLRGMTYATSELQAEILLQMDADLSHDPAKVPEFISALDRGASMAVGSRYIPGGSIPDNWGIHRKVFSVVGNAIVRYGLGFTGCHDWTGGFRAFERKYYDRIHAKMEQYKGYVFQIAFLHNAILEGAQVAEVPIRFTDRKFGKSKIAPSEYIRDVLVYVARARITQLSGSSFMKFLVVGGIGFIINAVLLRVFYETVGWSPAAANLIGAAAAIFSNYNLNNLWTFSARRITSPWQYLMKMLQFFLTSSIGVILIQTGTIFLGVRMFGESGYFLYFLIGTGLLLVWNYAMYSKVIWKNSADR